MMAKLKRALFRWIPFAIVVTFIPILSYGIGQQVLRQTADNKPTQLAQDIAFLLSSGQSVQSVISTTKIDMSKSLSPFVIIYNEQQQVIASSGTVNGKVPALPIRILDSAKKGEERVTWQLTPAVRDAVVIVPYSGKTTGYVVAGRSLGEVEKQESEIASMTLMMWIVCLIILYGYFLFVEYVQEYLHESKVQQLTILKGKKH